MSTFRSWLRVFGAREHNLKNISVSIPKEALTIITGPSGSGKSSLALDVLYAEGQRRYLESLSSYARQFIGMPKKPDIDRIDGLCPAIAIEQKTVSSNPRSTVGTITELYDYLRVLFARIGTIHCAGCGRSIQAATPEAVAHLMIDQHAGQNLIIAAPIAVEKKGEFVRELEEFFAQGFYRFVIDGRRVSLRSRDDIKQLNLKKTYRHSIDLLVDAVEATHEERPRLIEALEKAFSLSNGICRIIRGEESEIYSMARMCVDCGVSAPELEPRLFSFNSPLGACRRCHGLGTVFSVASFRERYEQGDEALGEAPCPDCGGKRLAKSALAVTIDQKNIYDLGELSLGNLALFFKNVGLSAEQRHIAERLLREIENRIAFLCDVGLSYLTLNRRAATLSGGEGQRIRLATQIGSALSGVLYILDEPSIGLHQRDNDRLIDTLKKLRDQGNTVLVVEHDIDTMRAADYIIDMGPAAGVLGGTVVASGTPAELEKNPQSLTGGYLSGRRRIEWPKSVRTPTSWITLNNARANNLQNVTIRFPLGVLCGISGVSGSGKSSLIMDELVPALRSAMIRGKAYEVSKIQGAGVIQDLIVIDQSPIGRTPRSNPATYLGIFDEIRKLYASLPESNARGYGVGRFSFNVGEGRCAECSGEGTITVSMHFLPDVVMTCSRCKGLRYNAQTLAITYKGKNIADVLSMTAYEAAQFFEHHKPLARRLQLMCEVGLDYIALGQPSTTLSGGEAQRIKLVDELAKRGNKTLYILDEPTTGLHSHDIERLLEVFKRLVDKGNSLIIVEHNLDVLKTCDYLIDMGPEGGNEGGRVVAEGAPLSLIKKPTTHTLRYLAELYKREVV